MYYLDDEQKIFYLVKSATQAPAPSRALVRFENDPIVVAVRVSRLKHKYPPDYKLGWPLSFLQEVKIAARGGATAIKAIENVQIVIDRWQSQKLIGGIDLMPGIDDSRLVLLSDGLREPTYVSIGKRFL